MELTVYPERGFFMKFSVKKRMGLLGMCSAVMIAAAALGMHGFQVLGTESGQEIQPESQEAQRKGQAAQPESGAVRDAAGMEKNVIGDVYPEEEFFETETDMTEFEGKLEDITA